MAVGVLTLCTAAVVSFAFSNRTRACLDAPRAGDLYMARISALRPGVTATSYALLRVEEVRGDRIVARASSERSSNKRRIYRQLDEVKRKAAAFAPSDVFMLPRDDLRELHDRGVILVARHLDS
ncbi:hypothetical protein [Lysobacter panacisoli]|uniref:Uncharacterized protein n=2 Tax=Lysobacter panacisoli TaxID=1255263 RepID=A0ABP9L8T9_9GAMM